MTTRPRVLLVDDHPSVVKALRRMLSPDCDVVGVLTDGREAADAAARLQPVVLVVDLNLPNVSGLEVCGQVRQNHPHVKIIVISALTDDHLRNEVLAAGASGFFDKFSAGELVVAIKRLWAEST